MQQNPLIMHVKRLADIIFSMSALLLLWPLFLLIALILWLDTGSPIFFLQERIGQGGHPFRIIKFRTMKVDAESQGPQLSFPEDKRQTRVGSVLRRYRLDELPQFINILKGDMSLVGPRPERSYFIGQISQRTPDYQTLLQMRPGLTSWGQVRFGYASTIEQIVERMQYDLYYVRNFSISFDIKIILHTIRIVLSGKGV